MTRRATVTAALALALGACGGQATHSKSAPTTTVAPIYTITGTMALHGTLFSLDNTDTISYDQDTLACFGTNGYDDIKEGAEVTVVNQDGKTIGNSVLNAGRLPDTPANINTHETTCSFSFTVHDIPRADFYKIEVAHRGQLTYSFSEMSSNNWSVEVSLGS